MKKIFCVLALTFASLNLFAHNSKELKAEIDSSFLKYRSEIGLMSQISSNFNNNESESIRGLQYKRWLNPKKAIRVLLAHQSFGYSKSPVIIGKLNGDTVKIFSAYGDIDMAVLGLGIELQRHFYKRIYITASLDLEGGYGKGTLRSDSSYAVIRENYVENFYSPRANFDNSDFSRAFVRANPSVGVKVVFNRVVFGSDLSFVTTGIFSQKKYGGQYTNAEFGLFGESRYRIFASFRF